MKAVDPALGWFRYQYHSQVPPALGFRLLNDGALQLLGSLEPRKTKSPSGGEPRERAPHYGWNPPPPPPLILLPT